MIKSFKYRLMPTQEQAEKLDFYMDACRFIYNLGLEVKIAAWVSAKINLSAYDLNKQITELKHTDCTWLKECPAICLESEMKNLDNAYKKFFKGSGFPNFRKKNGRQSVEFRQDSVTLENKIKLTKIGYVEFIKHRELMPGAIRTVTVSKTKTGAYYVAIMIKDEKRFTEKKVVIEETAVGIDVGLKTFATLSDGQQFDNPKYLHKQLRRLKKEQRTLKRRFKLGAKEQSKGYYKQRLIVAKIHEKIANQRKDYAHKISAAIIKQYDTICIEDLNISGMLQNDRLSKSVSDVGWHQFFEFLSYKADWYGKNIIKIGRFLPSSKICSDCGNINQELKLSDREWPCEKCGTIHQRDHNAAKNIKSFGLQAKPSSVNEDRQAKRIGCEPMPPTQVKTSSNL